MVGIAGRESQQDCMVKVELREDGGIEVKIKSNIYKLFGKHMVKAAIEAAEEMGVKNAIVEIIDYSSLDFVIRARTKTAIKRAWRGIN